MAITFIRRSSVLYHIDGEILIGCSSFTIWTAFWFECAALLLLQGTDVRVETCVLGNVYLTMPEASVHEKDRLYSEETTAMQAFELASSSLFG